MQRNLSQQPTSSNVYIGLIPFDWDEDDLKAVVCGLGNVVDVRLGFDHVGKNKGYAFIEYENPQQAIIASQLISKIQVVTPGLGHIRKFRTEVSKDSYRSNNSGSKSIVPLKPEHLPPGVQFPPEIAMKYSHLLWVSQAQNASLPGVVVSPNSMLTGGVCHTAPLPGKVNNTSTAVPPNANNTLPEEFMKATQFLKLPRKLPFAAPDKINETLSHISPPQLIELIANLKNILNSSGSTRAAEVFQFSQQLAASATQALLLMGFIDEEVIQEAMKVEAGNSNPQSVATPPPQQQNNYQTSFNPADQSYSISPQIQRLYTQNYGQPVRQFVDHGNNQGCIQNQGYSQSQNQDFNQSGNGNPHSQRFSLSVAPYQGLPQMPPTPSIPQTPTRWPNLPLPAQMKLSNLPEDQAELIVQVLSLTADQVNALPSDRQSMVAGIKRQYS